MVFLALFAASSIYALIRGGAPERITALLLSVALILSMLSVSPEATRYKHAEASLFLVDLALFAALYLLSLFTTRFWPIWMSAMQGLTVLGHVSFLDQPGTGFGYAVLVQFWCWPMQVLLIAAAYRHRQRMVRSGIDRPWASSSAHRPPSIPKQPPTRRGLSDGVLPFDR
jgi:hypothetical protein